MLIILSGVSGAGKNTVICELIKRRKDLRLFPTCTTREKRKNEREGQPYFFLTKEGFLKKQKDGEFFETQETHGNLYGVLNKSLEDVGKMTKIDFIKDIDVCGNIKLKKELKENALSIFLDVPEDELFRRLIARGESEESARFRLSRGAMEKEHIHEYDYVIENLNLEETVQKISDIIEKTKKQ